MMFVKDNATKYVMKIYNNKTNKMIVYKNGNLKNKIVT